VAAPSAPSAKKKEGPPKRIELRLSPEAVARLGMAASVKHRTPSEVAEELILTALPKIPPEYAALAS
jgi:hypothetical protein